ncbi:hypothetical protein [Kiritimatiella glycovorans]|uniref:VWFA domain-containing protein n=1 Tax=Kiritimatiella glycovorans TaxID=1307763 RepID=A0A0G3EFA0_9BACT|nr:hypothetical protein [Kiritimatiella glycovorans]AKJ64102.1 hypothetical protein L21SP4_00839 [Kiritimatiella glycovorans]
MAKIRRRKYKKTHWTRNAALVSMIIHALFLFTAGSIVAVKVFKQAETTFEGSNRERPKMELRQLKIPVTVKNMQRRSRRPAVQVQPRLAARTVAEQKMPDISLPSRGLSGDLAGGMDLGGSVEGLGTSGGSLGFGISSINFFGVKSEGERVMFLISAHNSMMLDERGGIPAYTKVKEEIVRLIRGMSPATVFNVAVFSGHRVNMFAQEMVPATEPNRDRVASWFAQFNTSHDQRGTRGNNYRPSRTFEPIGEHIVHQTRALMSAFEQQADSIFMIAAERWSLRVEMTEEERIEYRDDRGWDQERLKQWREVFIPRARKELERINRERQKKGLPPAVYRHLPHFIHERWPNREQPPAFPHYSQDDQEETIENAVISHYRREGLDKPSVNIILFRGKDEEMDRKSRIDADFFDEITQDYRGTFRVLEGLEGIDYEMTDD